MTDIVPNNQMNKTDSFEHAQADMRKVMQMVLSGNCIRTCLADLY